MKCHHRIDEGVKEWKLVYFPKNVALEKLLIKTVEILELDGVISVSSSEQIEDYVLNRGFFAGIEFNHPDVSDILQFSLQSRSLINLTIHIFTEY